MQFLKTDRAQFFEKIRFCPYFGKKDPKIWYFVFCFKMYVF